MANYTFFMNVSFDISYERSSDEEEEGKKLLNVQTARSAAIPSAHLTDLEKIRHKNNTLRQTVWAMNCCKTLLAEKQLSIDLIHTHIYIYIYIYISN